MLIDDLLLRTVGVSIPPFDLIWIFEQMGDFANREAYNPEKINEEIKMNRELYDLGEISREAYEKKHTELMERFKIAQQAEEMGLWSRMHLLDSKEGRGVE